MKLGNLLLASVGAAVLLGAFVSSAYARNLSLSSQTDTVLWRSLRLTSPSEPIGCEVKLTGTLHSRTIAQAVNALIGYITEASIIRCPR